MQLHSKVRRLLIPVMMASAVWQSAPVHSITLGAPQVQSTPGTGWVAELPLRDLGQLRLDQISVRLAPSEAWKRAQLETPDDPQRYRLGLSHQNQVPVLRIESDHAVAGHLDLLIELQWPRGRMLREVGILFGATPDPNAPPSIRIPASIQVQQGDTASALVRSHLEPSATLSQALMALQQSNPDAFVEGNVNRLRAGVILDLPKPEEVLALDPELARQEFEQQTQEWLVYRAELAGQPSPSSALAPQVATGQVQTPKTSKPGVRGDRLTLSAPTPGGSAATDKLARQRNEQQVAEREAELKRNIQDLDRLLQSESGKESASGVRPSPVAPPPVSASTTTRVIERLSQLPAIPWLALAVVLIITGLVFRRVRHSARAAAVEGESGRLFSDEALNIKSDTNRGVTQTEPDTMPVPSPSVAKAPGQAETAASPLSVSSVLAGVSLDLPKEPPKDLTNLADQAAPQDISTEDLATFMVLRWALVQELWHKGFSHTSTVMAKEIFEHDDTPDKLHDEVKFWLEKRS